MKKPQPKPQPPKVHCAHCVRCAPDTSGPSFSIVTGRYFMGSCPLAHADGRVLHHPDGHTLGRVFLDKPRACPDFRKAPHQTHHSH